MLLTTSFKNNKFYIITNLNKNKELRLLNNKHLENKEFLSCNQDNGKIFEDPFTLGMNANNIGKIE